MKKVALFALSLSLIACGGSSGDSSSSLTSYNISNIQDSLQSLVNKGESDSSFVIFQDADKGYYVQAVPLANKSLRLEAIGDQNLSAREKLTDLQKSELDALGWESPDESGNYSRIISDISEQSLGSVARVLNSTLRDIYKTTELEVQIN